MLKARGQKRSGEEISGENGTNFNLGCPTLTLEQWRKKGRNITLNDCCVGDEYHTKNKNKNNNVATSTGGSHAPSPSGTGERVRARVLHDSSGKMLQIVRLETVVVVEFVREEMLGTVHGTVRGRDEDDQPSGFETVQQRGWVWWDVAERERIDV